MIFKWRSEFQGRTRNSCTSEFRVRPWNSLILAAAGVLTLGVAGMVSARGQNAQNVRPQMSEEAFKDIRVLKGIPVDEFMDVMGMFSASLGYCCTDCHVKEAVGNIGAFATQTPKIQTARR